MLLNVRVQPTHTHTQSHTVHVRSYCLTRKTTMSFPANGKIYSHCLHINSKYANIHYVAENLFIRFRECTFIRMAVSPSRIKCDLFSRCTKFTRPFKKYIGQLTAREKKSDGSSNNTNIHLINFSVNRAASFHATNTHIWGIFFLWFFGTTQNFGFVSSFNQKPFACNVEFIRRWLIVLIKPLYGVWQSQAQAQKHPSSMTRESGGTS